ncbi:hypothetical protein ACF0H5_003979 [Mactra antiquata]
MMDETYKEGETLINNNDGPDSDDGGIELSEQQNGYFTEVSSPSSAAPSKTWAWIYILSASVMASLGGVLFGYDMGIISGAILQLRDVFCLSCLDQELVISAMLMGAVVGSLIGGFLIDHCGRRLTIIINAGIFLIGAIILGISPNFSVLVIGRILVGFAVSVSATGECIYISEIAPAHRRGLLVSLNELGITLGLLLAYLCNFVFISEVDGWRWMFALSAIPAVIQGIGMFFLPMSPRFLMLKKKEDDASKVLKKLRGTNSVDKEISGIRVSLASEKNQSCLDVCSIQDGMRGRMFIGVGLVFFQQFTGQPNVLYYAPTIFEEIGFKSNSAATLATVGLGVVKVVMTVFALICVDKFGRRRLLLIGAIVMGLSVITLGIVCHFESAGVPEKTCVDHSHCQSAILHNHSFNVIPVSTHRPSNYSISTIKPLDFNINNRTAINDSLNDSRMIPLVDKTTTDSDNINDTGINDVKTKTFNDSSHTNTTRVENLGHSSTIQKVFGFSALMCYVAAYGFSFGPVTWLVLSEIFPATIRGRAIAIATVFNWGTNLIVTFTFLDIMNGLGVTWTFTLFGIICAISVIFIYSFVPETKNRSLEQVSADLKAKPPMSRLRQNWKYLCCYDNRHQHGNYRRVQISVSHDRSHNVSHDRSHGVSHDRSHNVSLDRSHDVSHDRSPDVLHDISHNVSHDISHNVSHDRSHNVSHDISHNVSHDRSHNVSHDRSPDVLHDISHNVSHDISHNVSHDISHNVSHDRSHYVLHDRSHYVLHDRSHNVSHDRSHNVSHDQSHNVSHDTSHDVLHDVLHDISHNVSYDTSHDVLHDISHNVSYDTSHDVLYDISHNVSYDTSHDVLHDISHNVSHMNII